MGTGFDFIVIAPFLPSIVVSSSLGIGYLFGKFWHFFVVGCSAVSCDFGVFMRGHVLKSYHFAILSPEGQSILDGLGYPCSLSCYARMGGIDNGLGFFT